MIRPSPDGLVIIKIAGLHPYQMCSAGLDPLYQYLNGI